MNKYISRFSAICLIIGCAFLVIKSLYILNSEVRIMGGSSDEKVNINAIVNFWEIGDFVNKSKYGLSETQESFSPYISSGPVALIPSLIGWKIRPTILYSRLASFIYSFLSVVLIIGFLTKINGLGLFESAIFSILSWIVFLLIPEWTFVRSLGELQGALWFFLGIGIWSRYKSSWSWIFVGVSVWLCKITYLPAAFIILVSKMFLERRAPLKETLFLAIPLLLWITNMAVRKDFLYPFEWLQDLFSFLVRGPYGVQNEFPLLTWQDRLMLNMPRWSFYYKAIFYYFFILNIFLFTHIVRNKIYLKNSILIGLPSAILFYQLWMLVGSPLMWPRHAQPALYLGYGLAVALVVNYLKEVNVLKRRTILCLLTVCFCLFFNNFNTSLFSDSKVRPEFRNFKGLFLNGDVFHPKFERPAESYQKLAKLSCGDLIKLPLKVNLSNSNRISTSSQHLCKGQKKLPAEYVDGNQKFVIEAYFLALDHRSNYSGQGVLKILYKNIVNSALSNEGRAELPVSILTDQKGHIIECKFTDRWSLGKFMIKELDNVFDLCSEFFD
jgi:hypothetical protein